IFLVSVPMAFVGLTHWSGLSREDMHERLVKAVSLMLIISIPVSAFLFTHAHTIIEVVYARGAFDETSVRMTGDVLLGMAVGLWAHVIGYVMIKALNAQMRNGIVVWVTVVALMSNVIFNLTMHSQLGALALGLGTSLQGAVLFCLTIATLGLGRHLPRPALWMTAGAVVLLCIHFWIPASQEGWQQLILAIFIAAIYWTVWIAAVPSLRHVVVATLKRHPISSYRPI